MSGGNEGEWKVGMEFGHVMALPSVMFEARVAEYIDDERTEERPIEVRLVYDSKLGLVKLPLDIDGAQQLFDWSLKATTGYSIKPPDYSGMARIEAKLVREMFERQQKSGLPLTVVLATVYTDWRRGLLIAEQAGYEFDVYRRRIEELDRELRAKRRLVGSEKSIILYAGGGTQSDRIDLSSVVRGSEFSSVYFCKGVVGILFRDGYFTRGIK